MPQGWGRIPICAGELAVASQPGSGHEATDGWLVTGGDGEPEIETSYGPRNAIRYPPYARFDLRVSKLFSTDRGELTLYLEVINLTNRSNVCCTEDFHFEIEGDGSVTVIPEYRSWAPIIPTVGVGWRF